MASGTSRLSARLKRVCQMDAVRRSSDDRALEGVSPRGGCEPGSRNSGGSRAISLQKAASNTKAPRGHVTGEALDTDDFARTLSNLLHGAARHCSSACACAREAPRCDAGVDEPRVVATLTVADAPGNADSGPSRTATSPALPLKSCSTGSPWRGCSRETLEAAQRGAARVRVEIRPLPATDHSAGN